MPPGEQKEQIRKFRGLRAEPWQPGSERVGFQMVDGEVRFPGGQRRASGKAAANDQAADQARPGGGGDGGKIGKTNARLAHRIRHHRRQRGQMGAGGNLRHHAAESRVVGNLAEDPLGQNPAIRGQNGGGRFVAGTLNPQDRSCVRFGFSFHGGGSRSAR
jgi:hypothetical protein